MNHNCKYNYNRINNRTISTYRSCAHSIDSPLVCLTVFGYTDQNQSSQSIQIIMAHFSTSFQKYLFYQLIYYTCVLLLFATYIIESPVVQSLINCDHEYVSLHENSWCKVLSDDKVKISLWMCVTLGSTALLNGGKLNWLKRWRWRAAQMTWSFQWSHNVTQQQASVTFPHGFRLIHLDKWCSSACGNSRVMVPAAQTSLFKIWDDKGRGIVLETRDPVSLSLKHVLFQLVGFFL